MNQPTAILSSLNFFLAFGVVIFGLFVFLWMLKRLSGQNNRHSPLKIKGQLSLGSKEKVVIIEVEDQWIIAGITSQSIQTLAQLPKPKTEEISSEEAQPPTSFIDIIKKFRSPSPTTGKNE